MRCALPLASTWWNSFPLWVRKHHYDIINAEISKWRRFQLWVNYVFFKKQLMVASNQRLLSHSGQAKQTRKHMWLRELFNTVARNALALKSIKIIFLRSEKSLAVSKRGSLDSSDESFVESAVKRTFVFALQKKCCFTHTHTHKHGELATVAEQI